MASITAAPSRRASTAATVEPMNTAAGLEERSSGRASCLDFSVQELINARVHLGHKASRLLC